MTDMTVQRYRWCASNEEYREEFKGSGGDYVVTYNKNVRDSDDQKPNCIPTCRCIPCKYTERWCRSPAGKPYLAMNCIPCRCTFDAARAPRPLSVRPRYRSCSNFVTFIVLSTAYCIRLFPDCLSPSELLSVPCRRDRIARRLIRCLQFLPLR